MLNHIPCIAVFSVNMIPLQIISISSSSMSNNNPKRSSDRELPGAKKLPPSGGISAQPPVLLDVKEERRQAGLPLNQQAIRLLNSSRTVCYANSGTNALLSSPDVNRILAELPPSQGLLGVIRGLVYAQPNQVIKLNTSTTSNKMSPGVQSVRSPKAFGPPGVCGQAI